MKKKPTILITNDDGINAPGVRHLWNSLAEFANLTVVAPATEQSAVGLSITIRHPLRLEKIDWPNDANAWSVSGTPADCVKLALNVVMKEMPDLIVSGINHGTNSGRNILYSGTVAGAIEGIMHNIPAIAFSTWDYVNPDFNCVTDFIPGIVQHVLDHPMPHGTLLNVNFPSTQKMGIQGMKMTRQGKEVWMEDPNERFHPVEGHTYYWLGAKIATFQEDDESDVSWLNRGYITAVPIHVGEMTDHQHLSDHKQRFDKVF